MKQTTLSVIVPNYNHARYLAACLDSILGQSRQPDEVLVIDDASTDDSVEVIERYVRKHSLVRLHRNERNRGVLPNLNWALGEVRGEFVIGQGADDVLIAGMFEKYMTLLAQHPQAALCCSIADWREVSTGLNWHMGVGMADRACYLSPAAMVELGKRGKLFIPSTTVIFRRQPVLETGGY